MEDMTMEAARKAASDARVRADDGRPGDALERLVEIMARLRDPDGGCPWDLEQRFETIAPYTIEEAYEVADAIERGAMDELRDELGDLLLQVVYHARLAEEAGRFAFVDVARAISAKMLRRHPHVFDGGPRPEWEAVKAAERAEKGDAEPTSVLDGVPIGLPALTRAVKLQAKAAAVGFDWTEPRDILAKVVEEAGEIVEAADAGADPARLEDEIGDLFFVLANLARRYGVDPEAATRATNAKFRRRFRAVETALAAEGRAPAQASLAEMDALWDAAKRAERER